MFTLFKDVCAGILISSFMAQTGAVGALVGSRQAEKLLLRLDAQMFMQRNFVTMTFIAVMFHHYVYDRYYTILLLLTAKHTQRQQQCLQA